ncbi:MAG: AMP-binding protein, partial [Gemmatimonadaceae bacterium]
LCGGEAWPPKLADALLRRGAALWNVYGPTETTIWSAHHHVVDAADVCLGAPLANTQLLVLEPSGNAAPLGLPGELWIGGDGLAIGYHGRPDLTAERFVQHQTFGRLYRTGDRVVRRSGGKLYYQGRLDDQVKLNGYRIELGEIESVLAAQPGVQQAVAAVQRTAADLALVAFVVCSKIPDDVEGFGAAMREAVRRILPNYMVPRVVQCVEALPLTPNGKIDRRALPQVTSAASGTAYVAARTSTESTVAEVWQQVLGRERVGMQDGFFDLGGNSLAAMRVGVRLGERLNVVVPVRILFEQPTPAALAVWLDAHIVNLADADMAAILAELDTLSDEEAHDLLTQSGAEPT